MNVLAAMGLSYKDFAGVDWMGFSGAAQRLQDKQADVTFTTEPGRPRPRIAEPNYLCECHWGWTIEESMTKKMVETVRSSFSQPGCHPHGHLGGQWGGRTDHHHRWPNGSVTGNSRQEVGVEVTEVLGRRLCQDGPGCIPRGKTSH